jgi:hypothetical protein
MGFSAKLLVSVSIIILCLVPWVVNGQRVISRWSEIGDLRERYESDGSWSQGEYPQALTVPGENRNTNIDESGHWLGAKDFTDKDGTHHDYYVAEGGGHSFEDNTDYNIPVSIRKVYRHEPPQVVVDGQEGGWEMRDRDEVDPTLSYPEMVEAVWRTGVGVTITRRSYATGQRNHANYHLWHYTLVNTGNMDPDPDVGNPQDLEELYFAPIIDADVGERGQDFYGLFPGQNDTWAGFYGYDYPDDDSLQVLYHWDGKAVGAENYDPRPSDGQLLAPQYIGLGVVEAPSTPNVKNVRWAGYATTPSQADGRTHQEMYQWMSDGTQQRTEHQTEATEPSDISLMSFGPYDMEVGDTLNFVFAWAAGSISWDRAKEVGRQYINGEITEAEKDEIADTGRDSLFQAVSRATWAYERNMNIPLAPPSPDLTVTSGAGYVDLQWSDVSSEASDLAGYRVYRAVGNRDGEYTMIEEVGRGTTTYRDADVERGTAYYYYLTAFDDGSENTDGLNPGESLESSPYANRTGTAAHPVRAPEDDVSSVQAVPNPYNINSVNLFPGEQDKILFVNLPPTCTVRIFTLSGDLVETIEHTDGSGDESWNLVSRYNQIVRSGIYVYHIESERGSTQGKLSIVR